MILPTLDEAENLRSLIPELLSELPGIEEVIVVDDGSTDGTQALVRDIGAIDSRVILIERSGPPGLTASIQEGIDRATGSVIAWMDADRSMAPTDLGRLVEAVVNGADLAVGSRFTREGSIKGQTRAGLLGRVQALTSLGDSEDSWVGVALSWLLNGAVLPLLLRDGVHDYTSGFIACRAAAIRPLRLHGDHGEYFINLWMSARHTHLHIVEVGYRIAPRRHGHSKTAARVSDYVRRGPRYVRAALIARRTR